MWVIKSQAVIRYLSDECVGWTSNLTFAAKFETVALAEACAFRAGLTRSQVRIMEVEGREDVLWKETTADSPLAHKFVDTVRQTFVHMYKVSRPIEYHEKS